MSPLIFFKLIWLHYKNNGLKATLRKIFKELFQQITTLNIPSFLQRGKEFDRFYSLLKEENEEILKIGILKTGGIGDAISLIPLAYGVLRKYPNAKIFAFVNSRSQLELFRAFTLFESVQTFSEKLDLSRTLQRKFIKMILKHLDIFFENQYVVRVLYNSRKLKQEKKLAQQKRITDGFFKKYGMNFDIFPLQCDRLTVLGKNQYELMAASSNLSFSEDDLNIILESKDFAKVEPFSKKRIITVHHGSDPETKITGIGRQRVYQTKNWFVERWAKVVEYLKKRGYEVIQLGVKEEIHIPGAVDMRGKTTIKEAAAFIKLADLHLDTEGGLVALAKAVRTKSLVLFGPTPIEFFGYKDNINLRAGDCHGCWWSKPDWRIRCPKGFDPPRCMDAITVELVIENLERHFSEHPPITFGVEIVDLSLFSTNLIKSNLSLLGEIYRSANLEYKGYHDHNFNERTGCYISGSANWEYIYVLKSILAAKEKEVLDAGAGRGALQVHLANCGYKVSSCDLNYSVPFHSGKDYRPAFFSEYSAKIDFKIASLYNLPYDTETFDAAYSVSAFGKLENKALALKELLRVLRKGGILVLTFDITTEAKRPIAKNGSGPEVFTEVSLKRFLNQFGMAPNPDFLKETILNSIAEIRKANIAGISEGLTVGGITLRKK
ncbi:MAG: hypothetical protein DRG40_00250 [Deltaproteobacteria bacterium]|nr:MAG: hypothetical protein DRG40_00250 [Deltaproteobacteria bacterium]